VLKVIVRRANLQTTSTIYNKETQLLAYADDIDIVGRSQSAVRDAYLALDREVAEVRLKINEKKTKYMIAPGMIRYVGQNVAIGDKHFEVVKEFVIPDDTNK
jgi:deoxyribose-phosphate aldolase